MALILPIFAAAAATVVAVAYTRDVIAASGAAASGAASSDLPSAQFLAEQGLQIVGPMQSSGGLKAWAAYRDQQPIPIYRMPDGKHWVIGTVIDAQGKDVNAKALHNAVQKPMGQEFWTDLERAHWISDGKPDAARIAYVFTDPNCPYCNQLWRDARPLVQAGQLQLRHILVGMLRPSSEGKAAAILASRHPSRLLPAMPWPMPTLMARIPMSWVLHRCSASPVGPRCASQQRRADEQCRPACHTRDDLEECPGAGADPHRHAARAAGRVDGQSSRQVASTLGFKSPHSPCTEFASGYHRASKSAPTP